MQAVLTSHAVVDGVLDDFRDGLGDDAIRYRNHVYRGLNYQRMLLGLDTIPDEMAFAWALRDIGIWITGWDYIPPSLQQVDSLAPKFGIGDVDRVRQMVALRHKVRPCGDEWVETFGVSTAATHRCALDLDTSAPADADAPLVDVLFLISAYWPPVAR